MRRWHWTALIACLAATVAVWMQAQKLRYTAAAPALAEPEPAQTAPSGSLETVSIDVSEQDRELVTLACNIAKMKKSEVYAVFGIEVPRTLPVDAEMVSESEAGDDALDRARAVATQLNFPIEPEIVQSRSLGQSFVDESELHGCSLIILGLPYRFARSGQVCLDDTAQFVLKNAPHRVWLVRGEPQERQERPERAQ